jgi:hypothetical protein
MKQARDYLTEIYLDWVNNYLTIEKFAEHNGLTDEQAITLLHLAKITFESKHPDA